MEILASILVALITAGLSLVGVVITCNANAKKQADAVANALKIAQAVTDTKIDGLTREVREHNGFAVKIPVILVRVDNLEHEVEQLKKYHSVPHE